MISQMIVEHSWYIILSADFILDFWISFFRFFLLCYQFIPVSLYVTLSCIYAVQGVLMENDLKMCGCVRGVRHRYDEVNDEPMRVRTGNLNSCPFPPRSPRRTRMSCSSECTRVAAGCES